MRLSTLGIVILAAGAGKRMQSGLPKVLHKLAGQPLIKHVVAAARQLNPVSINIVYSGDKNLFQQALFDFNNLTWVEQQQQLGTGHALQQALPHLTGIQRVLVLAGDVPLISVATVQDLLHQTPIDSIGILTANNPKPFGLGRILRDATGEITAIVEESDATAAEKQITEINTGIFLLPGSNLHDWLPQLQSKNAQQEYYLPDVVKLALADKVKISATQINDLPQVLGVNTRTQLAELERLYQQRQAAAWLQRGVSFADPARVDFRGEVKFGPDCFVDINAIFSGKVKIGAKCYIGPNVIIKDSILADKVEILANSVVEGAQIGPACVIGPMARIRSGTKLAAEVGIGNFVEIKNANVDTASKIKHLSYVGDAVIGKNVNIGAGTITCNYDGANKYQTVIEDDVFVGSDSQLIAPVTLARGATIAAGTTVCKDAPAAQLTLTKKQQVAIANWQRPQQKSE